MNEEKTIHIAPPKRIETAAVLVLTVLAIFLIAEAISAFQTLGHSEPAANTITVSGEGKVTAAPDTARITFSVIQQASTAAAAQDAATKQANAALDYVKGQGIEDKDVKTVSYNVSPQYDYNRGCPPGAMCPDIYPGGGSSRIVSYEVSETIQVTVHDLDKVSSLLGGIGQLNVQNVYGPDLVLDDPMKPQNEAREVAIDNAKAQAEVLADQLGVRLVRIVSFNENGGGYPYPMYAKAGMAMDSAVEQSAPPVPTGENEYSSSVSITYEIR